MTLVVPAVPALMALNRYVQVQPKVPSCPVLAQVVMIASEHQWPPLDLYQTIRYLNVHVNCKFHTSKIIYYVLNNIHFFV